MPQKRKHDVVTAQFFTWKLWRRGGVYQADGRTNSVNAGRHSLDTRDRNEALASLRQLDLTMAVELGLADKKMLLEANTTMLDLEQGRSLYMGNISVPEVAGGASKAAQKRYRAVLDKFVPYAQGHGVAGWGQVTRRLLQEYSAWLEDDGYADRTIYLEITTLKQLVKFLVEEGHLPETCRIVLPMTKPNDSPTYCYTDQEVKAMVNFCMKREELVWLGQVLVGLARTGARISELANLRWTDVDADKNNIRIANDPSGRKGHAKRRRTKNRRDRSFPIHTDFLAVLDVLPRHSDGRVFHGPLGGLLKPDTVRNNLTDKVLPAVAAVIREQGGETEIERGRLHSFRHYFCSFCANNNTPMQMVMDWLGHRDSGMVRYYYHLSDPQAQKEMKRLSSIAAAPGSEARGDSGQPGTPAEAAGEGTSTLQDTPGETR
jgi:integrase